MAESNNSNSSNNTTNNSMAQQQQQQQQQHQQLLLQQHQQQHQQQLFLMQQQQLHFQQQQQLQRHQQQQQPQQQPQPSAAHHQSPYNLLQQQQAMSRFPSNIDAHLRAPGLRSLHFQTPNPPPSSSQAPPASNPHHLPPQSQPARPSGAGVGVGVGRPGNPVEVEMAQKDAMMVCNPDYKRPFASVEDAVLRLLPYHVVSDYEAEEDDRILDNDTTGQIYSRLQHWDHNILSKIAEFTTTFEKQVLAFNIMSRKRSLGEFRSEERLMIEQALLQEEKQALLEIRAQIESREKAGREAAEAKMRMAMVQAEHARAEAQAQAQAEMYARAPMRASAAASLGDEGSGHDMGQEQGGNMDEIHGWGNAQREDEEPSEDFLNDENEPENGDTGAQGEWREAGELDLNSR